MAKWLANRNITSQQQFNDALMILGVEVPDVIIPELAAVMKELPSTSTDSEQCTALVSRRNRKSKMQECL